MRPPCSLQDFTAHIGQANVATFATPREGSAPPLRFLFHAQAAGSGARILVQVGPGPCCCCSCFCLTRIGQALLLLCLLSL